ncbi:MAG TPA: glycosyltransferase [bacterium]|nr:glycosyltransferase [bacterium]HPQ66900.1 glycosyltransferase [bacterium]
MKKSGQAKTVLLLYISVGQGHARAARALGSALRRADPGLRVVEFDILELWDPRPVRALAAAYRLLLTVWPGVYDQGTVRGRVAAPLKRFYRRQCHRLDDLMADLSPAATVCTQALPAGLAAAWKQVSGSRMRLVAVPTDYLVHGYWVDEGIDLFLLPSREAQVRLAALGAPPERLKITGIPASLRFGSKSDPEAIRNKYGFGPGPIVLVMGGGEGQGNLLKLVGELEAAAAEFQTVAVTGRNYRLLARLKRLRTARPLHVFGFIDSIDELMEIADVIVSKPGGLTVTEALIKQVPMVLVDPIPGQETGNALFLQAEGAALKAAGKRQAAEMVASILGDADTARKMREAAGRLRRPRAAQDAADLILTG